MNRCVARNNRASRKRPISRQAVGHERPGLAGRQWSGSAADAAHSEARWLEAGSNRRLSDFQGVPLEIDRGYQEEIGLTQDQGFTTSARPDFYFRLGARR